MEYWRSAARGGVEYGRGGEALRAERYRAECTVNLDAKQSARGSIIPALLFSNTPRQSRLLLPITCGLCARQLIDRPINLVAFLDHEVVDPVVGLSLPFKAFNELDQLIL